MRRGDVTGEIVSAVRTLSRHRLGALILWDPVGVVEGGVDLEAVVSRELLVALAVPEHVNRLHRGAVIVRGCRIKRAAVPLTWATVVERAAEFAAGVAVRVDEDTGEVRIANRMAHIEVVKADKLAELLHGRAG